MTRLRTAALLVLLLLVATACVQESDAPVVADPTAGGSAATSEAESEVAAGSEAASGAGSESEAGGASEAGSEAAGSGEQVGPGGRLAIATGGTSGVYFVYGGGIAEQITANLTGYEATAEVTSASVDNMLLIADGGSQLAFTLADTAADAVSGEASFTEPVEAVALANLYSNFTQVGTTAGTGITTIEDLRGKRVSLGAPGSGTEVIALRILEAAGIDPQADLTPQGLGIGESVQALRDGTIDAFFWSGGLPTGGITDLASTDELVLLPLAEYTSALQETYGDAYQNAPIPAGTYPGLDEEVATIAVPNYLVVSPDLDDDLAHAITQLLFEQQEELTAVHPEAGNLNLETAQQVAPLELHPGAQRYYDEAG